MHADLMSYLATVDVSQAIAWAALIPALIAVLGMIKGGGSNSGGTPTPGVTTETTDPNLTAIMALQRQRMEMQNPLYEAVQRLAMGLMPTAYQTGNNYPWAGTLGGGRPGASTVAGETPIPPNYGGYGKAGNPWQNPWNNNPAPPWSPDDLRRRGPIER